MGKDKFVDEKEYEEILTVINSSAEIAKAKNIITKIVPNDIKLIAKNDSQKKLIQSIKNNEITICSGKAGTGKAQPLDSLILGENGFVRMGDIKIGDRIFTMNGNLTNVIGIFPQGEKDIYEVEFTDNSVAECCDEHLWLTKSNNDRNNKSDFKIRQLSELKDDILIKRDGRRNYSIPITKPISFNNKKVKIHPYVMGVLIGDGCFSAPNVRLTTIDDEIINDVNNYLPEKYVLSKIPSSKIDYSIIMKDREQYEGFTYLIKSYDLLGLKSENKFIPNDYLINDIDSRIALLQGLMDSDGTIENKSGSLSFTTASKKLINDFKFLIESLGGIVNKLIIKKGKYKKNNITVDCKLSYTYSFRLPNNIIPFKLERKLNLFREKSKYFPIRYIKDIRYVGKKEAQCIMVDDDNHTYLTNDLIVTHNTFVAVAYALSLLRKAGNRYKRIYLVKSVTTLKKEEIGFLKGDMKDKFEPFMLSFFINMEKVIHEASIKTLLEQEYLRPFPLAYIKGASLDDCIIIADEMQNIILDNALTLLTRLGSNAKMIILGDIDQIDLANKKDSSLEPLLEMYKDVPQIGTIAMDDNDDNVRNPLIDIIVAKYKEYLAASGGTKTANGKKQLLVEQIKEEQEKFNDSGE